MQLIAASNTLNSLDGGAFNLGSGHQTTIHDDAVQYDAARAALALAATFFGPSQVQLLTQHVEQALHRKGVESSLVAVDGAVNWLSDVNLMHFQVALPLLLMPKVKHIMLSMLDWGDCRHVERSDNKLSGAWVFRGTRVPVRALFENLESGASIDEFLEWFPGVTLEQAVAVLAHAEQSLAQV